MTKHVVQLDDKYTQDEGQIYLSTLQAMVRLPLIQRRRDVAAGLNTAGLITGYRGSPIGTYDMALWAAQKHLDEHHIQFIPGVNEELAAASIKGAQWLDFYPQKKYDGVFSLWYGKHLGVERGLEAMKAGNYSGSSKHGGVLILTGDDMGAKSSITSAGADLPMIAANMPILYPATTEEFIEYGLYGWAMSRFSGIWVGLKGVTDTIELTSTVSTDTERMQIVFPEGIAVPPEGLHAFKTDFAPLIQERRMVDFKLPAVEEFTRANGLNRVEIDSQTRRLGIVTAGKPYLDVREALVELGIDDDLANELGIRLLKLGVTWPLEKSGTREFCRSHDEILVVEEKSPIIEDQLKSQLYSWPHQERPAISGKRDPEGAELIPGHGEASVNQMIDVIARRLAALGIRHPRIDARLSELEARRSQVAELPAVSAVRTAYFCSGCPHNTSTRTIDGSLTFTGVGCYGIVPLVMPDRDTEYAAQMGAEGTLWVGLHRFMDLEHSFQNLGDGTYYHSGILAIRSAISAGANITYKLLYNDAVAMTGGQPLEGELSVEMLANQLYWEGVKPIVVVTDEPDKYPSKVSWPPGTGVHHRNEMESIQRDMQKTKGVSAIIYDQTCAAEKRRRRKRGLFPDPDKRLFINQDVCEGCGDCSTQSNCMSVQPVDTEFGRKRRIDQSSCNKDFSCQDGFCPSFVSVQGGSLKRAERSNATAELDAVIANLPSPGSPELDGSYNILLTGIGGTGVLTVGAILGMAAHIDGKASSVMDITGMAQKGGAVLSHIRLSANKKAINAPRLWSDSTNLLIGCDLVVSAGAEVARLLRRDAQIVVNSDVQPTAQFQREQDIDFGKETMLKALRGLVGDERVSDLSASSLATRLLGDSIATNVFMLGFALQKGLIPLSVESVEGAIRLNGVAIDANLRTLVYGRVAAHSPGTLASMIEAQAKETGQELPQSRSLEESLKRRIDVLKEYQHSAYAAEYENFVEKVRGVEQKIEPGSTGLVEAVSRYLFKLMAYKDEYEVARLYTNGDFERRLKREFEGDYKLKFHLAPPIISPKNEKTGKPGKIEFGSWMFKAFAVLAKLKFLRGTVFDVFGYSRERQRERALILEYRKRIEQLLETLNKDNYALTVEIASLPDMIRGYGHIKEENIRQYEKALELKLDELKNGERLILAKAA